MTYNRDRKCIYLKIFVIIFISFLCTISISVSGIHIKTVSEGLLADNNCYIGAYLGGNQGSNGSNYYKSSRDGDNPYETQIMDNPSQYGETTDGSEEDIYNRIDTGITTFRNGMNAISPGSGNSQTLFSRYYRMDVYPDNDNGKVKYKECPGPSYWIEKVIKQGGIPVVVIDPYSLLNNGVIDLSATNSNGKTGIEVLQDLAGKSKQISDANGGATVLIWFAHEFNAHNEVNPEKNDYIDSANKQAFRRAFRDAYTTIHAYGGPNVQIVWGGNECGNVDSRIRYWPGKDDNMNDLPNDYVDWVGMTWYRTESSGAKTLDDLKDFYNFYAKNHPLIFLETSADAHNGESSQLSLKNDQVSYLYNPVNLQQYPNIKGIIWFNVAKEGEFGTKGSGTGPFKIQNFLLPDGVYTNNGADIPGNIGSISLSGKMMSALYPGLADNSYFVHLSNAELLKAFKNSFGVPTDPNGDQLFEDVNGNGVYDFSDVVKYYQNMDWIPSNEPIHLFDYNHNGRIDYDDLVLLFQN